MRGLRISVAAAIVAGLVCCGVELRPHAQSLSSGLFDRYVDALRQEYRIPGLSVVVLQNGAPVVNRGFGLADVAQSVAARSDTPYPIANLTESISAAVVLQQCVDYGSAQLGDQVIRWTPFPDNSVTLRALLGHTSTGAYRYDPDRFDVLGSAAVECADREFALLTADVLERAGMMRSAPGSDAAEGPAAALFSTDRTARYRSVLAQLAIPYRIVNGAASRGDYAPRRLTASNGLISTALDLAQFDTALDRGLLLSPELLSESWPRSGPTGLGWFVQGYGDGTRLVWNFGVAKDAYSSLIVKVPERRLTLIMLANSDRLATSLSTSSPDVTQSIFARTFLRLFVD